MNSVTNAEPRSITAKNYRRSFPLDPNTLISLFVQRSQQDALGIASETALGKGIVDSMTKFVIGKGLRPESAPETEILKVSPDKVRDVQNTANALFRLWANDINNDWYGKNTFYQQQTIAFKSALITGDVLHHRWIVKKNGVYTVNTQNISGTYVQSEMNMDTKKEAGGVIVDQKSGNEIGYMIAEVDETLNPTGNCKRVNRYDSVHNIVFDLIHYYDLVPGLRRGISIFNAPKDTILSTNRLIDANVAKALAQALFTAVIESDTDTEKEPGQSIQDKLEAASWQADDQSGLPGSSERKEDDLTLGTGAVIELLPGEKMNTVESSTPGPNFKDFFNALLDVIGASTIPRELLLLSFGNNYSASRATIQGAEKGFEIYREEHIAKYCTPVWEMLFDCWVRQRFLDCPGYFDSPIKRKAWMACTWSGVTTLNIDPLKEVKAKIEAINAKLLTRNRACKDLFSMDFQEVAVELSNEEKLLDMYGLSQAQVPRQKMQVADVDENEDKQGDDDV